ncbi:FGGY-family carbohydrate kinase [Ciceribacter azotifigens]|uniref:FGGY-family carbohydrate kinase n=1 Tax=Ciceribacter azotifigens TaxID=2069303 RepID=UPI003A872DCD
MTAPQHARVAVIDIGKTNAKVVVLDGATGAEIAVRRTPNRVIAAAPYPHYDVEALWKFILSALAEFARAPGFDAISITTHGASAALLDAQGRLALPVLDYEFEYPGAVREAYDRLRPDFAQTCSPRLSGGLNLGAQLHFQKSLYPDLFGRVATILTYPQYWAFRLTGVAANEVTSLGCHTDLWSPGQGRYSTLIDKLGIGPLMAPVRSAFDVLGPVQPEVRAAIGLDTAVPVYCGIHDSNASLLPHLVGRQPPFSVVSTGTWVVCFAVGSDPLGLDPVRDTLSNVDAFARPVPSARFMGGREFQMLTQGAAEPSPQAVELAARAVIAKAVMVLPNAVDGSGPFQGCEGRWIGEPSSDAERIAAVSLYVAMMTVTCLDLVKAAGPIVVEGPMSRNRVFLAALASITGRDVMIDAEGGVSGTALGAAMLAGVRPQAGHPAVISPLFDVTSHVGRWRAALASDL